MLIELFSLGVTAESLQAKRDRKLAILLQLGHFDSKFQAPTYQKNGWWGRPLIPEILDQPALTGANSPILNR